MKALLKLSIVPTILTAIIGYSCWYLAVPAINIFDYGFILLLFIMAIVFFGSLAIVYALAGDEVTAKTISGWFTFGFITTAIIVFLILPIFSSPFMRAKDYSNIVSIKTKDFKKDFPESNIDQLALLSKTSAKNIGNSYLGTIDKVSQFNVSDEYRQITINKQPYRISPLEYASLTRWYNNRKDGIH